MLGDGEKQQLLSSKKDLLVKKVDRLGKREEQLRKKEEQLRQEKEQLRKKEEQLRDQQLSTGGVTGYCCLANCKATIRIRVSYFLKNLLVPCYC